MAKLIASFEDWGRRWMAVAVVLGVLSAFAITVSISVNGQLTDFGLVILLTQVLVIWGPKYLVLGMLSAPVYSDKGAVARSFLITLTGAVVFDIVANVYFILARDSTLSALYWNSAIFFGVVESLVFWILYATFKSVRRSTGVGL